MTFPFYIVDVFACEKYTGNPLAVIADADGLSDREMQAIALEMNYSETTFILSREPRNNGYDVRIFTPNSELPFAGHPTLGTVFILREEILENPPKTINLNLKVGQIPVTLTPEKPGGELLWMQQKSPTFGPKFTPQSLAEVLNLHEKEIDLSFPIQEVSTGIPFIIVPLKTHNSLKKARIDRDKYFRFIETTQAKEILIFCPETDSPENDLSVRVFAESLGIPEDPATGSANGCLAGYLVEHSYFKEQSIDLRVEQGREINRPSLLFLQAQRKEGQIEVFVGGRVVAIAKGELV